MRNLIYILFLLPYMLFAQKQKTVSGKVLDKKLNTPVIGAYVYISSYFIENDKTFIANYTAETTTDMDGYFVFKAPKDTKYILISYMGYESKTIEIINKSTGLVIELEESNQQLEEVVLMGYQKIERRKITSSYTKIKVEDIKQSGVANIDQMLAEQIAGLSVQQTNGAPGAPVKIRIRGIATLNGSSDPLWILDGIPLEGNDIPKNFRDKDNIDELKSYAIAGLNPEDIESITVLKDASATSIYGARAANGVIVITSKRGKKGKMRINVSINTFITQKPDFSRLNLMNSNQKVDFELDLASRLDLKYKPHRGEVARILNSYGEYDNYRDNGFLSINPDAQIAINNLKNTNTNWGNKLYQMALNQQYSLSISGGSDKNDYYFSAGYFDEKGTTIGTGQKRFNLTLKNNYSISDKFKIGVALFGNQNKNYSYLTGIDAYTNPSYYARTANPYLKIKDTEGNYIYDPDLIERSDLNLDYNISEERENTNYELTTNSLKAIFDVNYKWNSNFQITSQLGLQIDNGSTEKFADKNSYFTRKYKQKSQYRNDTGGNSHFLPQGGIIQNWNRNAFQYNWKTTINYNFTFNQISELDFMIGTEFRKNKNTIIHTKGFGFNPNTLTTIPITNKRAVGNANFEIYKKTFINNAYASFYGTGSYTYDKKYTLFSSLRYDGSNLFGVDPKYRYLPIWSVAGSWNLIKEDFMYDINVLSELKLRASYGIQGNIDKTTSPFVIGKYYTESILPGVTEEVIRVQNAPNKNLRWEKTLSSNIGFDMGLWNNKLFITGDYYYRKSTDLIGLRSVPLESGYNFINTNWATISNRGFELAINSKNINNINFKWNTNLNISYNKSLVDEIEIREESFKPSIKGYGVNAIFTIKTAGLDNSGFPLFWKDGKKISAVDFYKLSGGTDGSQLSREEHRNLYTYAGDSNPKFSGGIINKFSYKQFNLRIYANFHLKQTVKRTPSYYPTIVDPGKNYSTEILQAGTRNLPEIIGYNSSGFDTDLVYNWFNSSDDGRTYNDLDIWIKEISYIRISNIQVGYSLTKKQTDKIKISNMRLFIEGRNLFVFGTDYKNYFDPETYGSLYAQPIPKIISLGINLSF